MEKKNEMAVQEKKNKGAVSACCQIRSTRQVSRRVLDIPRNHLVSAFAS